MESLENTGPVPETLVVDCSTVALTLAYSAPTPGVGSRYADGPVSHESRILSVTPVREALARAGKQSVGETLLDAVGASRRMANFSDARSAGYLVPLARAALLGRNLGHVLRNLGNEEIAPFGRALEVSGTGGPLVGALQIASGAGKDATLRDAMRYAANRDALAREYARGFEVSRQLAQPALLSALSRTESARAAVVHSYLEVLSEVPDLDVVIRAGRDEAEEVSRMARGVLKSGGVRSRRGLQAIANLDGILRANPRLSPTATEPPVVAAAFLVSLKHGPRALGHRVRPASNG